MNLIDDICAQKLLTMNGRQRRAWANKASYKAYQQAIKLTHVQIKLADETNNIKASDKWATICDQLVDGRG